MDNLTQVKLILVDKNCKMLFEQTGTFYDLFIFYYADKAVVISLSWPVQYVQYVHVSYGRCLADLESEN
jgi:hypothetical protein